MTEFFVTGNSSTERRPSPIAAKGRVGHSEDAERFCIVRLFRDQFGRFDSRSGKCSVRR